MKRILVVACFGFMLAALGSSCAQPRVFAGGGFGRPLPQRYFYGARPSGIFVQPRIFIAPRPNAFAPRPWGFARGRGWRRGC